MVQIHTGFAPLIPTDLIDVSEVTFQRYENANRDAFPSGIFSAPAGLDCVLLSRPVFLSFFLRPAYLLVTSTYSSCRWTCFAFTHYFTLGITTNGIRVCVCARACVSVSKRWRDVTRFFGLKYEQSEDRTSGEGAKIHLREWFDKISELNKRCKRGHCFFIL